MIKIVQLFSLMMITFVFTPENKKSDDEIVTAPRVTKSRNVASTLRVDPSKVYQTRTQMIKTLKKQDKMIQEVLTLRNESELRKWQQKYRESKRRGF